MKMLGFPGGTSGKKSADNQETQEMQVRFMGWERPPAGGQSNPLQCSCLENLQGQRSLVGYSPQGLKESDMTEATQLACMHTILEAYINAFIGIQLLFFIYCIFKV